MRTWRVAGGLLADERGLLLVANRRRNGSIDWSTPGGVIDEGETALGALSREVHEETGLVVTGWEQMCWTVEVEFVDLELHLDVEVHRATEFTGSLAFDDPDGIVHDGDFLAPGAVNERLRTSSRWVAEPLGEWLAEPWTDPRHYRYRALGRRPFDLQAERLSP